MQISSKRNIYMTIDNVCLSLEEDTLRYLILWVSKTYYDSDKEQNYCGFKKEIFAKKIFRLLKMF